ncbi:dihydrofolate reductase [Sediminitomix flava]|uniref:Dihydrofolate reductase n=2 Tax=Sediminitomix flava TaxID=379075 RepID=A0A315ZHF1_SEDFL|nr:dihydrofolate reductase [Sediminitomix flava]
MEKRNVVYIAKSLDGYIADKDGGLDWLHTIPNPDNSDMGFMDFISQIDALVMGRNTFEVVCGFGGEWPYPCPVFVISNSLQEIPEAYKAKAELVKGSVSEVLAHIHSKGHSKLYIDGGKTIQSFLKEDLIDDLIISTIPVLLGGGASLFGELPQTLAFEHVDSKVLLGQITQDHYKRKRD